MSTSIPSLTSLLQRANIDDHDEILKAAEQSLKENKNDLNAQHVRVVALLKLDRFEDALRAFETAGAALTEKAQLEYAYALYKAGKTAEAASIAHQSEERGHKHVEAQASYRTEDFQRAAELYRQLFSTLGDDAIADLRINTGAVDAQLEWACQGDLVQKKKPAREDLEAFETAYNAACGCIARGELAQSEVLLKRARDLCTSSEDLSAEEKEAELLPITVQQVYVLTRQGKTAEAEQLAKSVDTKSIPDASTRLIAEVNGVAAATSTNPFLAQRVLAQSAEPVRPDHPFNFQSAILTQNQHAIALQSLKFSGTADSTSAQIAKEVAPTLHARINGLAVINAAAHAKSQTGKEGLKHILPLLEKRPNDVGLILTIVQLYVLTGNTGSAISLLESFFKRLEQSGNTAELDVRFAPGLVGTLVSLYHGSGRRGPAQAEFAKAAQHWRRKSKECSGSVLNLLKAAGSALTDSHHPEHTQLARDIFADLHDREPNDPFSSAGVLAASPDATSTSVNILRPIDRLTARIDVDALEEAGIARPPLSADAAGVSTRKRRAEDLKPKKPKRIRKSRLPKDYDPNKKADPERWLPLRDRSTYRPKGKKGKARQNLLSQGAAPTPGDSEGSRPTTPAAEVVKGKQLGGGGGGAGANARKKKGRK